MGSQRFLTVFLVDGMQVFDPKQQMPGTVRTDITTVLMDWFQKVALQASAKGDNWTRIVKWVEDPTKVPADADPNSMQEPNLICYFVPTPRNGALGCIAGMDASTIDGGAKGYTAIVSEYKTVGNKKVGDAKVTLAGSEVYCTRLGAGNSRLLAGFAFHELMHNAQQLGDNMHDKQSGIAAAEITASTVPTDQNIRDMAAGLAKTTVPQWKKGRECIMLSKVDGI